MSCANFLAETIKATRKKYRLSQRMIAQELGVNFTYISKLENNRADYPPSDRFIGKFATRFNLDYKRLMLECGRIPIDMQPIIALGLLQKLDANKEQ